jgi:hypothetical protein
LRPLKSRLGFGNGRGTMMCGLGEIIAHRPDPWDETLLCMDDQQKLEFLNELLTETIQELMIYRRFALSVCEDTKTAQAELDLMLDPLRSDVNAIRELRDAWHVYLETHLASGGMFPRTLLLNFCEEWTLPNRRKMD